MPGKGVKKGRLVRFGYAVLTSETDTILGPKGLQMPVHEFHYWDTTCEEGCFEAHKPLTERRWHACIRRNSCWQDFRIFIFRPMRNGPLLCRSMQKLCRWLSMRTGNEERKVEDIKFLKAQLNQQLFMISQPNEKVMEAAWQRWDSIGKPLRSLGALERAVVKMAGMENTVNVKMDKRAIVVLCGDHGVVKEGVTQTDSSVTKIVADNIASGKASINIMAGKAGADVFPVDVGMMGEHYPNKEFQPMVMCDRKVAQGTGDIAVEPAMTQEQCLRAILAGIEVVADLSTQGYEMIGMGEMGIGNTTPSVPWCQSF